MSDDVSIKDWHKAIREEREMYRRSFTTLFEGGPGYLMYPPFDSDPDAIEVSVFINDSWAEYRPTLFSLEGMFGDGTTFGIEFTEEDWDKLAAIVEERRADRH